MAPGPPFPRRITTELFLAIDRNRERPGLVAGQGRGQGGFPRRDFERGALAFQECLDDLGVQGEARDFVGNLRLGHAGRFGGGKNHPGDVTVEINQRRAAGSRLNGRRQGQEPAVAAGPGQAADDPRRNAKIGIRRSFPGVTCDNDGIALSGLFPFTEAGPGLRLLAQLVERQVADRVDGHEPSA